MRSAPPDRRVVLVDTTAYGAPGLHWCEVIEVVGGDIASCPVRVRVPSGITGEFAHDQVREWRP